MVQLEGMVDAVGLRNVLYALAHICGAKEQHVLETWQDKLLAREWAQAAKLIDAFAGRSTLPDPLERTFA